MLAVSLLFGAVVCVAGDAAETLQDEVCMLQTQTRVRSGAHLEPAQRSRNAKPPVKPPVHPTKGGKKTPMKLSKPLRGHPTKGGKKVPITEAAGIEWTIGALMLLAVAGLISRWSRDLEGQSKYLAEFVGTFMFVFSVGCNTLSRNAASPTWGVTATASTLMVLIYALGGVSAHFNPVLSFAMGLCKKMPWREVAIYTLVQLAAGILAGVSYSVFIGDTKELRPAHGHTGWQAGFAEMLYTSMLVFVFLNTAVSKRHGGQNQYYGLAIAFVIIAGGYGAGSISGGCFNPAVALGVDSSSSGSGGFGWCFVYGYYEFLGCVLAVGLFRVCRPEDFEIDDDVVPALCRVLTSEFLGTFMLVLTVSLNVLSYSKAVAFSAAASLTSMIFALSSCSGAHFNPAVTLSIACAGQNLGGEVVHPTMANVLLYMLVQTLGGTCGAFTAMLLMNGQSVALIPATAASTRALGGELIFTFLLCFVVLSVATVKNHYSKLSEYFGLAIGSCVIAGSLAIGSISGGSLNPAVSAGLAFSDATNGGPVEHFVSYAAIELLGGVLAAFIFRRTHALEYTKSIVEEPEESYNVESLEARQLPRSIVEEQDAEQYQVDSKMLSFR